MEIKRLGPDIDFNKIDNDVMQGTWKTAYENQSIYDYNAGFLDWIINPRKDINLSTEDNGRMTGFFSALRRKVSLFNEEFETYLGTMFAVHPQYQRKGLGYALFKECARTIIDENGCPFFTVYLDKGHSSTLLVEKFEKNEKYGVEWLTTLNFYTKLLDIEKVHQCEPLKFYEKPVLLPPFRGLIERVKHYDEFSDNVHPFDKEDAGQCMDLLNGYARNGGLAFVRKWDDEEELCKQLSHKDKAETLVFKKQGDIKGLLNYYFMTLMGKIDVNVAVLDNAHLDLLTADERLSFMSFFLQHAKKKECAAVIMPNFEYFDRGKTFSSFSFFPYPRNAYMVAVGRKEYTAKLKGLNWKKIYFDHK
jgi:GNAT superfamily N-acetyltransferase